MKALVLSAAAAMAIPTAANANIFTLGGPLAVHCYNAAESRDATRLAIEACSRSLAEEPLTVRDRAATLVNRGILFMIASRYGEAEANFDAAIALDPALPDSWLNKGFLRLRQGAGRAALPLIDRALELRAERQALAYYARGIANEQAGNIGAAYADLQRARALDPDWDLPVRELARYQRRNG